MGPSLPGHRLEATAPRSYTKLRKGSRSGGPWFGLWISLLRKYKSTQRLQCASFLVMTYFLLQDENILPKKELHSSLWACTTTAPTVLLSSLHLHLGRGLLRFRQRAHVSEFFVNPKDTRLRWGLCAEILTWTLTVCPIISWWVTF